MLITNEILEIKRKVRTGCIESMLDLANSYGQGKYGVTQNTKTYLNHTLKLLQHIDEIRESQFSSSHIYYEIVYSYLEQYDTISASYYLDKLLWELLYDYLEKDLEEIIGELKIRELAIYLDLKIEEDITKVKECQKHLTLNDFTLLNINDFYANR